MNLTLTNVLLVAVLALSACCEAPPKVPDTVLVPATKQVSISEDTLQKCDLIPHLDARKYSEGELVDFTNKLITQSEVCRARQSQLSDIARTAFNIPKPTKPK